MLLWWGPVQLNVECRRSRGARLDSLRLNRRRVEQFRGCQWLGAKHFESSETRMAIVTDSKQNPKFWGKWNLVLFVLEVSALETRLGPFV